jgi:hypothetical protein
MNDHADRRTLTRYTPGRHPLDPLLLCSLTVPGLIARAPAALLEASARGAGLYLRDRVEPGDLAALEPAGPRGAVAPIGARVAHVAEAPGGGFRVGIEFDGPLSDVELRALLGED